MRGHPSTPAGTADEKTIHGHYGDMLLETGPFQFMVVPERMSSTLNTILHVNEILPLQ